ncbi:MAG: hypothetical protein Q8Q49_03095 [bacterium]|nr:hypothetical protein [bacterium]
MKIVHSKDVKKQYLHTHQDFPATKKRLVEACNNLSDFSEGDKMAF